MPSIVLPQITRHDADTIQVHSRWLLSKIGANAKSDPLNFQLRSSIIEK